MAENDTKLSERVSCANNTDGNASLQIKKTGLKKLDEEELSIIQQIEEPRKYLADSTKYIKAHINIIMKVAEHLYNIHKYKLFRLKYNSFKDYVNEEFNYTRGRAYQLRDAHELAVFINKELGKQALKTEPQCRELLKVKIYEESDEPEKFHQSVDHNKSNQERLKLVKEILEKEKEITTKLLVDKVREWQKAHSIIPEDMPVVKRYDESIDKSCKNIEMMMDNIIQKNKDLTAGDFETIKSKMKERLEAISKYIDGLELPSDNK